MFKCGDDRLSLHLPDHSLLLLVLFFLVISGLRTQFFFAPSICDIC